MCAPAHAHAQAYELVPKCKSWKRALGVLLYLAAIPEVPFEDTGSMFSQPGWNPPAVLLSIPASEPGLQ